jgi:hypothetical protein
MRYTPSTVTTNTKLHKHAGPMILDSAFDSYGDSDTEISEELCGLSGDNVEYTSAEQLDRRVSYDSRFESGNEDYEIDDFVVDDSEGDDVSEVGSEITVAQERVDEERRVSTTSNAGVLIVSATARTASRASTLTNSTGSGLFVSDPNDNIKLSSPLPTTLSPTLSSPLQSLADGIEPADVAEEIVDAVCRFSRRCNRNCTALRLSLTKDLLDNEEVKDALETAVKAGLGRVEEGADGKVSIIVGDKK